MLAHVIKPALVQHLVFAGLRSIAAGLVVLTAGRNYKPTRTQCLLNAGQYPFSSSQYFMHDALNQSWVNVRPPSLTLAHIQRGAKHDMATQY